MKTLCFSPRCGCPNSPRQPWDEYSRVFNSLMLFTLYWWLLEKENSASREKQLWNHKKGQYELNHTPNRDMSPFREEPLMGRPDATSSPRKSGQPAHPFISPTEAFWAAELFQMVGNQSALAFKGADFFFEKPLRESHSLRKPPRWEPLLG